MVSITRWLPLSTLLALLVFSTSCGEAQSANGPGADRTSAQPAAGRTEQTTTQPRKAEAKAEDGGAHSGNGAEGRAGNGGARAGNGEARAADAEARAGNAVAGDGEARAGDLVAGTGKNEAQAGVAGAARKATLGVKGTPGTRFSGTCTVGRKREDIGGRVPERFVFDLNGRKLECRMRLRGPDALEVVLTGDGVRAVQRISGDSTVDLTYSSSGVSVTTSSVSTG